MPRVAVVGHVEWVEFARVPHMPEPGEIVHASEWWEEAGGGGAVAAVQLAKLAGSAEFFTALGDDDLGRRARERLEELGVTVYAAKRPGPQRRGVVHLDGDGERTITILGERIVAHGDDDLPWERLADVDAVYFTGGDVGALQHARTRPQARRHAARVRHAARGRHQPRRARPLRPRPRRAAGRAAARPRARLRRLDRRQGGRRSGWGRTTRPAPGRPPSCPARRATPTARATRSPPA